MTTWSRGRRQPDPDSNSGQPCRWDGCGVGITHRFWNAGIRICQDHALQTWAVVQEMSTAGQVDTRPQPKPSRPKIGSVYYLRIGDRVKIGFTTDIFKRLASYPPNIVILAIREGSLELERQEHIRFGEHRTDGREWFEANERVLEMIEAVAAGTDRDWEQDWFGRQVHRPQEITYRKREGDE